MASDVAVNVNPPRQPADDWVPGTLLRYEDHYASLGGNISHIWDHDAEYGLDQSRVRWQGHPVEEYGHGYSPIFVPPKPQPKPIPPVPSPDDPKNVKNRKTNDVTETIRTIAEIIGGEFTQQALGAILRRAGITRQSITNLFRRGLEDEYELGEEIDLTDLSHEDIERIFNDGLENLPEAEESEALLGEADEISEALRASAARIDDALQTARNTTNAAMESVDPLEVPEAADAAEIGEEGIAVGEDAAATITDTAAAATETGAAAAEVGTGAAEVAAEVGGIVAEVGETVTAMAEVLAPFAEVALLFLL
jgi:hypothetical protein